MAHPFHIPEKWKWIKLKHLATIVSGTSYKADDIQRSGVRIIRGGNLIGNVIKPCKDDVFLPHNFTSEDKTVASTDIVIVSSTGSKEGIGRSAVLGEKFECQIGAFLRIVRPKEKENSKYLQVLFRSNYYREYIRNIVSGTNINNIKNSYIEEFYAPVPPQEEQSRICSKLHECFSILAHAEHAWNELQALSENLKALLLLKAIKGEIVPQLGTEPAVKTFESSPKTPPYTIPEKWKWTYLGNVITLVSGRDLTKNNILIKNEGIPYITGASQIKDGQIVVNRWTNSPCVISEKGDLLLTCKGTVGKMALNTIGSIHIARQIMAIRPSQYVTNGFLHCFLQYLSPVFKANSKSMIPGIDRKTVLEQPVPIPPLEEQQRIVKRVRELVSELGFLDCN